MLSALGKKCFDVDIRSINAGQTKKMQGKSKMRNEKQS